MEPKREVKEEEETEEEDESEEEDDESEEEVERIEEEEMYYVEEMEHNEEDEKESVENCVCHVKEVERGEEKKELDESEETDDYPDLNQIEFDKYSVPSSFEEIHELLKEKRLEAKFRFGRPSNASAEPLFLEMPPSKFKNSHPRAFGVPNENSGEGSLDVSNEEIDMNESFQGDQLIEPVTEPVRRIGAENNQVDLENLADDIVDFCCCCCCF